MSEIKTKDPQASKGVVKGEINSRHSAKETVKKKIVHIQLYICIKDIA